jgi:D-lactate dehydrogenase (cytochrome)
MPPSHEEPRATLVASLLQILPIEQIDTSESALALHARGESYDQSATPSVVVYPTSTAEVQAVVALAARTRTPVTPVGMNSSLEGHTVPIEGGISLDLTRMNRILEVAATDALAVVQPGVTYPRLNEHLRATGLFFPVDPGAEATLGGMASTNASGTMAVRYGVTRDRVLGLEVVTPSGTVIRTGTRAPKSSSGYALTQLFCGAEGTLGVITELTLALAPRPEAVLGARFAFEDVGAAVAFVADLIAAGVGVARCELLDPAALHAINAFMGTTLPIAPTIFLEFHGDAAGVATASATATELAHDHGATATDRAHDPGELARLWRARHQAYYAFVAAHPGMANVITDLAVPVSALARVIDASQAATHRLGLPSYAIGHVGDGNFHLTVFFDPTDADARERVDAAYGELVAIALAAGGTCTGEHGIGLRKRKYVRAEHGDAVDVMWAIKDALDPLGIMNPGKKLPARSE